MTSEVSRRIAMAGLGASVLVAAGGALSACSSTASSAVDAASKGTPTPRVAPASPPPPVPTFDKGLYSLTDPTSLWVIVNKQHPLSPVGYVPPDLVMPDVPNVNGTPLRQAVATALEQLFASARQTGLRLTLQSGYRSYRSQTDVYDEDVAQNGQAYADTDTARPGHSEHQAGLACDISPLSGHCALDACMGQTPEGEWLAANAWQYGFLLRYPADKVPVTGFTYEPWHFRYVGGLLAAELRREGVETLEEFFGVSGGTVYPS